MEVLSCLHDQPIYKISKPVPLVFKRSHSMFLKVWRYTSFEIHTMNMYVCEMILMMFVHGYDLFVLIFKWCFIFLGCEEECYWSAHCGNPTIYQAGSSHHYRVQSIRFCVWQRYFRAYYLRFWRSRDDGNGNVRKQNVFAVFYKRFKVTVANLKT